MKKITIITGHYGSGKTNLAVNLALRLADAGEKVTIVDFDIVNPYFRTADFAKLFEERGVTLAASMYANTSLDIPAISFDMERMAYEDGYLIIDVGGDDAGAIGLGRYAEAGSGSPCSFPEYGHRSEYPRYTLPFPVSARPWLPPQLRPAAAGTCHSPRIPCVRAVCRPAGCLLRESPSPAGQCENRCRTG